MNNVIQIDRDKVYICDPVEVKLENYEQTFLTYKRSKIIDSDVFFKIVNKKPINRILPHKCRYFEKTNFGYNMVIEEEPSVRNIEIEFPYGDISYYFNKLKREGKTDCLIEEEKIFKSYSVSSDNIVLNLSLSFPYTIFIISLYDSFSLYGVSTYFRLKSLSSLNEGLINCPLTNIDSNNSICMPPILEKFTSVEEAVDIILSMFWNSTFNFDYIDQYILYNEVNGVSNYIDWAYNTKKNPLFIFDNIKWIIESSLEQALSVYSKKHVQDSRNDFDLLIEKLNNPQVLDEPDNSIISVDELYLEKRIISIGESLVLDNKVYYLNKIYAKVLLDDSLELLNIEVEDSEGKKETIELNHEIIKKISESFESKYYLTSIELNNQTINIGDILQVTFPEVFYLKVENIIKINDRIEIKCGHYFYNMSNIKYTKVGLDTLGSFSFINIDNKKSSCVNKFCVAKLINISVREGITFTFNPIYSSIKGTFSEPILNSRIIINEEQEDILKIENLEKPNDFRISNILVLNGNIDFTFFNDDKKDETIHFKKFYIKDGKFLTFYNSRNYETEKKEEDLYGIFNTCDIEKAENMYIPGLDFDIEFSIGDKVVYANWDKPSEITTIYEIKSFSKDSDYIYINISSGNVEEKVPYICIKYFCINGIRTVNVGSIRHIVPEYCGIKAGDYIVTNSKKRRIKLFPSGKSVKIIGFLNDTYTHFPLMLCSNNLTQWVDVSRFEDDGFEIGNSLEFRKKFKHTYFTSADLENQQGDLFRVYRDQFKFATFNINNKTLISCSINHIPGYGAEINSDRLNINSDYKRHGFVCPRYYKYEIQGLISKKGWYNLHCGFNEVDYNHISVLNEIVLARCNMFEETIS